jgi:plastocyanin
MPEDLMSLIRLVVVSVILTVATACGSGYSSPSTSPSPTGAPPAPAAGGMSSSITIPTGAQALADRAYTPGELDVPVGATVTWMNTDSVAHTSTSNVAGWDSGIIAPAGQFAFTFAAAGTFQYHCAIHPGMVGTVVVR